MDHASGKISAPFWIAVVALVLSATVASAQTPTKREYQYQGSKIEGERETPKDLYILPWQGTALLKDSNFQVNIFEGGANKDRQRLAQEYDYFQRVGENPGTR